MNRNIPNIVKIADLTNFSNVELNNVVIKVSVSISSHRHGSIRHGLFYMDLRDDSGEITAVAYAINEPCENHLHRLQPNRTYTISNFSLEKSNKRYTSLTHSKEIVLNNDSVIILCGNAPKCEWPLTPLCETAGHRETDFFNIVGLCTRVTETEIVHNELMRKVTLMDEFKNEVVLNVWNQETSIFDELDLSLHPVFFVKDAKVYYYRSHATPSLTTSRYLQLLDPEDSRAVKITKALIQDNFTSGVNADRTVAIYAANQRVLHPQRRLVKIADLSDTTEDTNNRIIATVTMISMRRIEDDQYFFIMDLRDDSGDILAAVTDEACTKYYDILQKNRTYSISIFKIDDSSYRTSNTHKKVIILKKDAEIKLIGNAPKVEWPMSPLTVVPGKEGKEFYHIFGLCTKIHEDFKGRRPVTLVDQLRRELFLEVEDEDEAFFDGLDLDTHPVIFVKDATKSDSRKADTVLTPTAYLELLEADDPRTRRVLESLGLTVNNNYGDAKEDNIQRKRRPRKSK